LLIARHAAIIGGGFSGTLLAINLLRHGSLDVTLIERHPERLAKGLAFGAAHAGHVLNVRAANMSAFPDQPGHFVAWLKARGIGSDISFATRRDYGLYLSSLLDAARQETGGRLTILSDSVTCVEEGDEGARLTLASGGTLMADMVALAPGNLPPHDLPAFKGLSAPAYVSDPWAGDMARGLTDRDNVLLLGSGLTAVDCALSLDGAGFRGRIVAMSRRGLSPHHHAPGSAVAPLATRPPIAGSALVQAVRARAEAIGWRNAVDELRPFTQSMWAAASLDERSRFLRHLRPFWDVHRHRVAPQVAERLDGMKAQGRLTVVAGKVSAAHDAGDADGSGLRVAWRRRGEDVVEEQRFARVINCTGPLGDLARTRDPLLMRLQDDGLIRPDALSIGIDVDMAGRAVRRDGAACGHLFVVGPMTRGAHWEIVAVPDIRKQVWSLARTVTGAHWVEAEGL
jgi:uncharacterized NAD(P)/FAD-binding protein YdhS